MPVTPTEKIWHNGKLIDWNDAKIHVLSHVVSYGSSVFEGIRCYETKSGPAIFRVREHFQRLVNSGKIYRIEWPYTVDDLSNAAVEIVRANKMNSCYIRPIALRGYGDIGVGGLSVPTEVYIACWEWGATWVRRQLKMAWTSASAPGIAWRPIPCQAWPRPAQTT